MAQNIVSNIVESCEISGALFLNAEFTAPWAIKALVTEEDCMPFMPVPRSLIAFHFVVEGSLVLSMDSTTNYREELRAETGDIIFLPKNKAHILANTEGLVPMDSYHLELPKSKDGLRQVRHGGGGERARLLCGFLGSNTAPSPLLELLPDQLVINVESLLTRRWIEASVLMAVHEFSRGRVESRTTSLEICKLLLTQALEAYVAPAAVPDGIYKGITHPRIAKALSRIHSSLDCLPAVEDLAKEVAMSRSSFVERFREVVGTSPKRYILNQRIAKSQRLLNDGQLTVAEIAIRVGYDSAEAFSRAFKREVGVAPVTWKQAM